jgi:hypothetical protein
MTHSSASCTGCIPTILSTDMHIAKHVHIRISTIFPKVYRENTNVVDICKNECFNPCRLVKGYNNDFGTRVPPRRIHGGVGYCGLPVPSFPRIRSVNIAWSAEKNISYRIFACLFTNTWRGPLATPILSKPSVSSKLRSLVGST